MGGSNFQVGRVPRKENLNTTDLLNELAGKKKSQALINQQLHEAGADPKLMEKLWTCGSWLHFREYFEENETVLKSANFCKRHLLCRACAARRAGKMIQAYQDKVEHVVSTHPGPLIPVMITLTVKNGSDLKERINHLKLARSKMLQKRRAHINNPSRPVVQYNKVQGSVRSVEITKSKSGEWHPHVHEFALLSEYIDREQLSAEWQSLTGDSKIVDVRRCKTGNIEGLLEVLKYTLKIQEHTAEDLLHVASVVASSRLVDPFGILRGIKVPDIQVDDDTALSGPYKDYIALWLKSGKYAVLASDEQGRPDPEDLIQASGGLEAAHSYVEAALVLR